MFLITVLALWTGAALLLAGVWSCAGRVLRRDVVAAPAAPQQRHQGVLPGVAGLVPSPRAAEPARARTSLPVA